MEDRNMEKIVNLIDRLVDEYKVVINQQQRIIDVLVARVENAEGNKNSTLNSDKE